MDSAVGLEQRGIEDKAGVLIPVNVFEDPISVNESDKEETTSDVSDEVAENRSRSLKEVEIGTSVALGAEDSRIPIETEIESEPNIALAYYTLEETDDHEKLQEDSLQIHERTREQKMQFNGTRDLDNATEIETSNEDSAAYGFIYAQTEADNEKILGMNIKLGETTDNDPVEESMPTALFAVRRLSEENRETVNPEESEEAIPIPESESSTDLRVLESDAKKEALEYNIELKVMADKEDQKNGVEISGENVQPSETENIVSVAVMDDFDIERTSLSVTEADINEDIERIEESVLEMNIQIQEAKINQRDVEKEREFSTPGDQENSPEMVDRLETPIQLEKFSSVQQGEICITSDLLDASETESVKKADLISLQIDTINEALEPTDEEDETGADLEEKLPVTNPANFPLPFVPNEFEEAIEFIDSETQVLQKDLLIDDEHPTETPPGFTSSAALASSSKRHVSDEDPFAQEEEEANPMVPCQLSPHLKTSTRQLGNSSIDNLFGSSSDAVKSTGRTRIRKPEWMRRSLVRSGSVRRLFGRMRSKRFDHDQLPVTPTPEQGHSRRPFRQMIVDFLLLLFES
ncbi:uncharacterized protein LOC130685665 [Daphnia carinata]|uniref:uncharacterized protein LOC130685665 n=1 Tax=Daphnia carinata TaxID=120202 RepID=UPI00257FB43A|nr:uncharacterized protein LOC130685665 [Daphnia carinata]XP_059350567.1 uncharacterized protein LOC130685665 [Daphnia carinata]XP_059350568.1 uncharacterized protein LOC130685665 [Daphnia carinata]XP_059350569.1 uncharacterized protein LOC130685665 [Daphnia carinata]XP_059350570.1 uncharacterized protein LOC130685665 [Daphnia carinata]